MARRSHFLMRLARPPEEGGGINVDEYYVYTFARVVSATCDKNHNSFRLAVVKKVAHHWCDTVRKLH